MPKLLKIVIALVFVVAAVGTMGMMWLQDAGKSPEYCGSMCHDVMGTFYTSWAEPGLLANNHANAAVTCQICHTRTLSDTLHEIDAYYIKHEFDQPEEGKFADESCEPCHGPLEQVAQRTANYSVDGEVVNPHDPHPGLKTVGQIDCYRCHSIHEESKGIDYCYSCHHEHNFLKCSSPGCHEQGGAGASSDE